MAPELKPYNIARAEPSPARHEVHAMYTGVLASSLRLRDLLDKQQRSQASPQQGHQAALEESSSGGIPSQRPGAIAEDAGAVRTRRQGNGDSVARSQLALLARALVDPVEPKVDHSSQQPTIPGTDGQAPATEAGLEALGRQGGGCATRDSEATDVDGDGDVSMAELDACLAAGSVKLQIEVPTADSAKPASSYGVQPEQQTPADVSKTSRRANKASARAMAAAASPAACVASGGLQRPLLRCNSPIVLCQAVQSAQARANMTAADVSAARSPAAAASGSLATAAAAAAALTPTQRQAGASAAGQSNITPGSARVRLQLPEPAPLRGLEASPKPLAGGNHVDKGADSTPKAAFNGCGAAAGDPPSVAAQGGGALASSAQRTGTSVGGPPRTVSRLNPAHPSNSKPGCGAAAARAEVRAAAGAGSGVKGAPALCIIEAAASEAAPVAAAGGSGQAKVPAAAADSAAAVHPDARGLRCRRLDLGEKAQDAAAESGRPGAAGTVITGSAHDGAPAQQADPATLLSPTYSAPGLTISQLAARAASSQRRRRRSQGTASQQAIDLTVEEVDLTADAIDLTKEMERDGPARQSAAHAAAASGGKASGRAADGANEAAAAAVTVQQLSAGDDEDNGAASPAGDEQQQPAPEHAAGTQGASRGHVGFAGPALQQAAGERKGRGRGRPRGRGRGRGRGKGQRAPGTWGEAAAGTAPTTGDEAMGAAAALGAATPAAAAIPLRTGDGAASGEESSPDVPIGMLAAAAAAAAAAQPGPLLAVHLQCALELTAARQSGAAVTPAGPSRTAAAAPAVAGPDASAPESAGPSQLLDSDLPIGVLAAAATVAAAGAGAAATKSPGSSPIVDRAVRNAGNLQPFAEMPESQAVGASAVADGSSAANDAEGSKRPAESRKNRRKRKRRSSTLSEEAAVAGAGAAGSDGDGRAQGGDPAAYMDCDAPAAQPAANSAQAPVPAPVPNAAPGASAGAGTTASGAGTGTPAAGLPSTSGAPLLDGTPLPSLATEEAPLAPVGAPAPAPAGGRVQLGQMWKRQRVGGAPPPAALLVGPRPGAAGRGRMLAGVGALGAPLPETHPPQPQQTQGTAEDAGGSAADRASSGTEGVYPPCATDVAMAEQALEEGMQQPEAQQDSNPKQDAPAVAPVDKPFQEQVREDGGSGTADGCGSQAAAALQLQQKQHQAEQCDAGSSAAAAAAGPIDADGSGPTDREDTPQPAAGRVHIRNMWKRPRMAEAPRAPAGVSGPTGRRAMLGSRTGPTTASAPVEDAARSSGVGTAAATAGKTSLPVVDGECRPRLEQEGEANGKGGPNNSSSTDGPNAMEEDPRPKGNAAPPAASATATATDSVPGLEALHRTPPRAPRPPAGLAHGVAAASPRASAGGSVGKPPRSPGDLRSAAVPLSPRPLPSPSPGGHRLRDPSLHPAAVAGSASLSPVEPLLSKFQLAAVPSPRSAVQLASAGPSMLARLPVMPAPSTGSAAAAAAVPAVAMDAPSPVAAARARSPLALLAATGKRDAAPAEASFLQPLAPIRTKAAPPGAATAADASGAATTTSGAAGGVKPSVVQAVEALLSIPLLADDSSPDCDDGSAASVPDADVEMQQAAAPNLSAGGDGAASCCSLERLLDVTTHGSVANGASEPPHVAALHSPLALLVDAAATAAQGGGEDVGGRRTSQDGGSADATAGGRELGGTSSSDLPSEGLKPLRSALRGMQRFFSALGPWVPGAKSSPVHGAPAAAGAPEAAVPCVATSDGGGVGGGNCSLVCDERLDMSSGKAASPLPPRPRPAGKPPSDASRAVPGGSRLATAASRLSPSKPDSPVASLRPSDGYSTPPCGTGRARPAYQQGPSGWPRSTSYPGHQYDSMIEDVVQQMLNEASPDAPPTLELGQPAACPPAATAVGPNAASAGAVACPREGVTGVVAHQATAPPASGDENEPLAVNGVAPAAAVAAAAAAGQSPQRTPPLRRSIYLPSPTGKRRRSADGEEEPDATAVADAANGGAQGGDAQHANGDAAGAPSQAPPLSGHRRRPRKAARVDGGSGSSAAAAAAAAVAASDKMNVEEVSNMASDESDSDDDMLDSYAAGGAGGGPARGAGGLAKAHGPLRGGPGRGPGSMFAGRAMPYGAPGGSNWMKPGLAWSRVPGQQPNGPARASPQPRGAFGPARPSPTGAVAPGAVGARPAPVGPPSCGWDTGSPGDSLLDVPRTLNLHRGPGSRRQSTYLSSPAEATAARPTLEQEYREALINARLAQAWAAGERWARCDLAGLPADLSKRGVTERLAQLDSAASKLNCYRGAEGASKIMAKVEDEWEHLKRIRMAAAARATARTPTGATPSPAPGHFPTGRPPHTPLPFAAHAHAHAATVAAAAAAAAASQANGDDAAAAALTQAGSQPDAAAATPPPTDAPAGSEDRKAGPPADQQPGPATAQADAAEGAHHGLAELVSAHGHAHCHRGSPPPPPAAAPRSQHTPSQPHHAYHHQPHGRNSGDPQHHHHSHHHPHPSPHFLHRGGIAQQRPPAASSAATSQQPQAGNQATHTILQLAQNKDSSISESQSQHQQQSEAGAGSQQESNPGAGEGFGTPVLRGSSAAGGSGTGGERPSAVTPPPGDQCAPASALLVQLQPQLTPPASILKTVSTPYSAFGAAAGTLGGGAGAAGAAPPGFCCATGGRKAVKFAAVLELGPQSGYRHTPAPLPRPTFDLSQCQSQQEQLQ